MPIRIVRLGSDRHPDEGLRIGTVRRPPRGVAKARFATNNWYDVWLPDIAPSPALVALAMAATTDRDWARFAAKYRAEMKVSPASHLLDLLAAVSHTTNVSVGCYCEHEARCHRAVLRELLADRGASIVSP